MFVCSSSFASLYISNWSLNSPIEDARTQCPLPTTGTCSNTNGQFESPIIEYFHSATYSASTGNCIIGGYVTESFDNESAFLEVGCDLKSINQWLSLFADMFTAVLTTLIWWEDIFMRYVQLAFAKNWNFALHFLLTLTLLWFALPHDYLSRNMWMAKSSNGVWSRCVLWGVVWSCLIWPISKSCGVQCIAN